MLLLSLGVWFRRRTPGRRPTSAPVIIFVVGAGRRLVPFVIVRARVRASQSSRVRRRGRVSSEPRSSCVMHVRPLRRESQISAFPQAAIDHRCTFVGNILPLSVMEVQPRLLYHFLHAIFPEQRVSAGEHVSNDSATRKSGFHRTMNDQQGEQVTPPY